jgi:peptide/nickel transport system ATP-binding protein
MTSLSPVHTVGNQIDEALYLHRDVTRQECRELTEQMLGLVGFPSPERAYGMYSMELSGGLRQRAMIAMALVCNPALLIADEPTTALDVTVQAQVLAVLKDVQQKLGMSLLLITHDLGVVANMADEILVLYHGALMEAGTLEEIFSLGPARRGAAIRHGTGRETGRLARSRPAVAGILQGEGAGTGAQRRRRYSSCQQFVERL